MQESVITEVLLSHQADLWQEMKEDEAEAGEPSYETLKCYKGNVKNFFKPYLGKLNVREVRYEDLERFKDDLRHVKGIKTRRNILNALHALFVWMRRRGTIGELPLFPTIEGDNSEERTALDYEAQAQALKLTPEEHRDPLEFGIETGLRGGEICALKVVDIDMINKQVLVRRTLSGSRIRETTKGKSKKWIPLSDWGLRDSGQEH
jgi:integrase